jgi:hypothetical protein
MAAERGYTILVRRTRRCIISGGPEAHRRFELVEPRDVGDLYRAIHRNRVLVVTVGACFVRSDPAQEPIRKRYVRNLEDYVRYKAAYGLARGRGDVPQIFSDFATWPVCPCIHIHDPRVLPLHVFDNSRVWPDLDEGNSRSQFALEYPDLRDACGRVWTVDRALHGRESLTVACLALPSGYHWDVARGRSTERLVTCHEIWRVKINGHVNVYPDAYVRSTGARRVWPRP